MPRPDKQQRAAIDELLPAVYEELRVVAQAYFRRQPAGFTLRPTDMVNEACLHLMQHQRGKWQNPEHFRAIAARKIWQVVIDHLKRRAAQKRGGSGHRGSTASQTAESADTARDWQRIPLDSLPVEWRDRTVDMLDLAEALDDLGAESSRLKDVVTLHWFAGMKYADVAECLGVSASTVEKDFRYALAWLNRRLDERQTNVD